MWQNQARRRSNVLLPPRVAASRSAKRRHRLSSQAFRQWALYLGAVMLLPVIMTLVTRHVPEPTAPTPPRFAREGGFAYRFDLPELAAVSDNNGAPFRSTAVLCEDGRALGPPHSHHREIMRLGGGRFSHWGPIILFSTSDGSDPNTNSRHYSVAADGQC